MKTLLVVIAAAAVIAWWRPEWPPPLPWLEDVAEPAPTPEEHGRRLLIRADEFNQCYLIAEVNGVRVKLLLDTGSSAVALSPRDASRVGINSLGLQFDQEVSTANGIGRAALIRLSEFRIGEFQLRDLPATVDENMDGSLLGAPVLRLLNLQFGKGFCALTLPRSVTTAASTASGRRKG